MAKEFNLEESIANFKAKLDEMTSVINENSFYADCKTVFEILDELKDDENFKAIFEEKTVRKFLTSFDFNDRTTDSTGSEERVEGESEDLESDETREKNSLDDLKLKALCGRVLKKNLLSNVVLAIETNLDNISNDKKGEYTAKLDEIKKIKERLSLRIFVEVATYIKGLKNIAKSFNKLAEIANSTSKFDDIISKINEIKTGLDGVSIPATENSTGVVLTLDNIVNQIDSLSDEDLTKVSNAIKKIVPAMSGLSDEVVNSLATAQQVNDLTKQVKDLNDQIKENAETNKRKNKHKNIMFGVVAGTLIAGTIIAAVVPTTQINNLKEQNAELNNNVQNLKGQIEKLNNNIKTLNKIFLCLFFLLFVSAFSFI